MRCWTEQESAGWKITFATEAEIPCWMELVGLVIDGFPYLDEEEYIRVLKQKIRTKQALILRTEGLPPVSCCSPMKTATLIFMGSHPLYRKRGVPKALLDKVMGELLRGRKVKYYHLPGR